MRRSGLSVGRKSLERGSTFASRGPRKTAKMPDAAIPLIGQACRCGCGRQRGLQRHHVVYQQHIRHAVSSQRDRMSVALRRTLLFDVLGDDRNLVWLAHECHAAHHARERPLSLALLPDSVFEFAAELLGPDRAYEYLRRRYAGDDPRLAALLNATQEARRCA